MNPFDLMKQGRFQEAYDLYTLEYEKTKLTFHLQNRVLASLNLKHYQHALEDSLTIIELNNGRTDTEFTYAGLSSWFLGDADKAVSIWKSGLNAPYTDAAGGVELQAILFFAAVSLQNRDLEKEATRLLKKRWKPNKTVGWPAPIAGYLLGQITEQDVLNSLSEEPTLRIRQTCQSEFYFAAQCLQYGDHQGYLAHLETCANSEFGLLEKEYYLAIGELDKMRTQ